MVSEQSYDFTAMHPFLEEASYTNNASIPSRSIQVLANGDIVECDTFPNSARSTLYKTELCKHYMDSGNCRYGSKCQFAHGKADLRGLLRHPKYKTMLCKAFVTTGKCIYGVRCRFIHDRSQQHSGYELAFGQYHLNRPQTETWSSASCSTHSDDDNEDNAIASNGYGAIKDNNLWAPFTSSFSNNLNTPVAFNPHNLPRQDPFKTSGQDIFFSRPMPQPFVMQGSPNSPNQMSDYGSIGRVNNIPVKNSRLSIFQQICREDD